MLEGRSTAFHGLARSKVPLDDEGEGEEQAEEAYEDAMVMAGGYNTASGHLDSSEIYSPAEDTWRQGNRVEETENQSWSHPLFSSRRWCPA